MQMSRQYNKEHDRGEHDRERKTGFGFDFLAATRNAGREEEKVDANQAYALWDRYQRASAAESFRNHFAEVVADVMLP